MFGPCGNPMRDGHNLSNCLVVVDWLAKNQSPKRRKSSV